MAPKTLDEILRIKKASGINDACFSHMLEFIKEGMTEIQIRNEIEKTLRSLGAEDLAFPIIAVSGERTALPHGEPTDKKVVAGEFLTMDFGPVFQGYCGDMTRTVAIGYATEEMKKIYDIVKRAQISGLEATKAGVTGEYVDSVCRNIIEEEGYGKYFIHGTGHGVGRQVHEEPWATNREGKGRAKLQVNDTLTVEPGIYIEGKFGVRIEDLAVVTDFGIINTNLSTKELIIL